MGSRWRWVAGGGAVQSGRAIALQIATVWSRWPGVEVPIGNCRESTDFNRKVKRK